MTEQIVQLLVTIAAIALGIMNYSKHRHLERDMKRYPLVLTLEIGYDDNFQPAVTVRDVRRDKSSRSSSSLASVGQS